MDIQTILGTYKRYLQTFKDKDSDLFHNYQKIRNFIDSNCNDKFLSDSLTRHCIGKNVREIAKRNFKIKDDCTDGWSSAVTMEGYQLLSNIRKIERNYDDAAYKLNLYKFFKLAENQLPHLQLYLYYCFCNRIGEGLFRVSMEEIEEAAAKAEEEAALASETEIDTQSETAK